MDQPHRAHALVALRIVGSEGDRSIEAAKRLSREPIHEQAFQDLADQGLVVLEGASATLTPRGREEADLLLRRYRLTEALMHIVFAKDREEASNLACQFEHDLRPEVTDALCTFLGHPATCPHGHPIPPGQCCEARQTSVDAPVVSLTTLKPGEKGRIVYIRPRSHQRLHRLTSMGLVPDTVVELHQRSPAWCVRFEGTEVALEKDVASDIHVVRM